MGLPASAHGFRGCTICKKRWRSAISAWIGRHCCSIPCYSVIASSTPAWTYQGRSYKRIKLLMRWPNFFAFGVLNAGPRLVCTWEISYVVQCSMHFRRSMQWMSRVGCGVKLWAPLKWVQAFYSIQVLQWLASLLFAWRRLRSQWHSSLCALGESTSLLVHMADSTVD